MEHNHTAGADHGSYRSYITGFVLSVILTVIPFALVMAPHFSRGIILGSIVVLGVVQILVHLVYFLHMNTASEHRWNLVSFVYAVIVVAVIIGGSLWIMYNMNYNMMDH